MSFSSTRRARLREASRSSRRFRIYPVQSDADFIAILASLENKSEHPIAHAVVTYAKKNITLLPVAQFENIKGKESARCRERC